MPNELPLPDELKHLLEKRTGKDRRKTEPQSAKEKQPKRERRKSSRRQEDGAKGKKR
jgi:hypothetical protein